MGNRKWGEKVYISAFKPPTKKLLSLLEEVEMERRASGP